MSSRAPYWMDQQAPRPRSRSQFQQAGHSQQYQPSQQHRQDQYRGAQIPDQRNSGSHLPHVPQYDDTSRSRERPKSEGDFGGFAHYVDPFGLQYHDNSRYSGMGPVSGVGTPSRPPAALKFPLYRETFAAKEKALKAAEEERLREAAKALKGLKKKRKSDGQVPPTLDIDASRGDRGAYPDHHSSNRRSYAENGNSYTNSPSYNQHRAPQNRPAPPPQTSPHNPLVGSRQRLYRSPPRHVVERDLPPLPPREYRHEPQRIRPHSDFIPRDWQYLQGGQGVHDRRVPGSSNGFASVPPQSTRSATRSGHQWPAGQRQEQYSITDDDSDVEYETITAEEAHRIPQDDFYAKLPKAFRRTASDGKLKKQTSVHRAPGSSLREPKPNALETYRLSSGNGDGFAPGGFQGFLPRKLSKLKKR